MEWDDIVAIMMLACVLVLWVGLVIACIKA